MVDAGLILDAKRALERLQLFRLYALFWLEQPLHPDDLEGYATVTAYAEMRIIAGEEEHTLAWFLRLLDRGCVDFIQIDRTRCGLTQSAGMMAEAHRRGAGMVNHNFTTGINTAATLRTLVRLS